MIRIILIASIIFCCEKSQAQIHFINRPDTSQASEREREAALIVYREYFEHITNIPQGKVNDRRLNSFVADMFTSNATIDLKILNIIRPFKPEQYFGILKGLYYGTNAKYTHESKIKLPPPSLEINVAKIENIGQSPVFIIKVKQEALNIEKVGTGNKLIKSSEDRNIKITIITSSENDFPKIKSITLEN